MVEKKPFEDALEQPDTVNLAHYCYSAYDQGRVLSLPKEKRRKQGLRWLLGAPPYKAKGGPHSF